MVVISLVFDFNDGGNSTNDYGTAWSNTGNYQNLSAVSNSNTWYHITAVFTGSALDFYVNGVLESQESNIGKTLPFAEDFALGRMNKPAYDAFNGRFNELTMWNRALSNGEIVQLFNQFIDTTSPTVVLTDSDADNTVVSGDSVVVTATFSEA